MPFEVQRPSGGVNDVVTDSEDKGAADPPPARRLWIVEAGVVVVVALCAAVLLRLFIVQSFFIPTGSMIPTLEKGDRIVVNKLSYDLHGVGRGDIVVFARPPREDCAGPPVSDLVKRVVGLPGESISLNGHGRIEINGRILHETWLPASVQGTTYPGPAGTAYSLLQPFKIPTGDYFVMGDARENSCDSRYWGPIMRSEIVGKVDFRVWPVRSFSIF
ncbi:MAG TPA: signal peptidase I [Acidimicrobiales bacterium]|nr:signal peptidase I [Acidimicrobiales bacterium]